MLSVCAICLRLWVVCACLLFDIEFALAEFINDERYCVRRTDFDVVDREADVESLDALRRRDVPQGVSGVAVLGELDESGQNEN